MSLCFVALVVALGPIATAAPPADQDHFAPLIGAWRVTGRTLQQDGQTWAENAHPAEWRFYRILGGEAIQDEFISPAPDVDVPFAERTFGTNIRIFNPDSGTWEMAWISTAAREALEFSATAANGELTMYSKDQDPPRRNHFHAIGPDTFTWRQDWSFDGGATWTPVVYLDARRVTESGAD